VLEKEVDFENFEKAGAYQGLYFILGGVIPLTELKPSDKLRFKELFNVVQKRAQENKLKEVIFATSATLEGDNTSQYAMKILEPLALKFKLKISKLGRGLSTGTELEYSDSDTISNALKNRG
jgi:recombination protein RecR